MNNPAAGGTAALCFVLCSLLLSQSKETALPWRSTEGLFLLYLFLIQEIEGKLDAHGIADSVLRTVSASLENSDNPLALRSNKLLDLY